MVNSFPKEILDLISKDKVAEILDFHRSGDQVFQIGEKYILKVSSNIIGLREEKKRNDRLWKVQLAVPFRNATTAENLIRENKISYNAVIVGDWVMFNTYCENQKQSSKMAEICKVVGGKISEYESKAIF